MEFNEIKVGIGDLNIAIPPDRLITIGLGSCVGIALYDSYNKIAGLAHIMLPESTKFSNNSNPMKFADLAIPLLLDKMISAGAKQSFIKAKIAGGASMFIFADKSANMDVGNRNSSAVKETLQKLKIPLVAEDIGGNFGRTMIIEAETGKVIVRTVGKDIKEL